MEAEKKRIGYYCWAGPGTVRMLNLKYFDPPIDKVSLMSSYDYDYLAQVKEKFGVTDIWVTYSWGFSPDKEQEDYDFVVSKLEGMHKLGLTVHAYIQGPNLVYNDFPNQKWWCRDERGRLITYYRGRKIVNLLDGDFRSYKRHQIENIGKLGFDGVYIDNIQFGQIGVPIYIEGLKPFVFFGSADQLTRQEYQKRFGAKIPMNFMKSSAEELNNYMRFRSNIVTEFVTEMASVAHSYGLQFGTNSFDPRLDNYQVLGTDLNELAQIQDYLFFENHSLPNSDGKVNNMYIQDYLMDNNINTQVFVTSYKQGIGYEEEFVQADIDRLFAEQERYEQSIAIKGSEYTTKGVWHNLRIQKYTEPQKIELPDPVYDRFKDGIETQLERFKFARYILNRTFNPLSTFFLESKWGRKIFRYLYYLGLH